MPIHTVRGPIEPSALGVTLMHEHVLVDFSGALAAHPSAYVRGAVVALVAPHLRALHARGCRTLVECTPAYLGRDPMLLAELSQASGLHILTNTGYYGAVHDRYLPPQAFSESASGIARRWIDEWARGIEGTGIRPAFMKISVDAGPLSAVDARIVDAAAITHRETGLRIHSHTPDATAGIAQLDRLEAAGLPASAFVWVHAQSVADVSVLAGAAARGAWIELDGVAPGASAERHAAMTLELASRGHFGRVLVSHDAGWYRVGEPGGAPEQFRGFESLWTAFVPALRAKGLSEAQVAALLTDHPRRALSGQA